MMLLLLISIIFFSSRLLHVAESQHTSHCHQTPTANNLHAIHSINVLSHRRTLMSSSHYRLSQRVQNTSLGPFLYCHPYMRDIDPAYSYDKLPWTPFNLTFKERCSLISHLTIEPSVKVCEIAFQSHRCFLYHFPCAFASFCHCHCHLALRFGDRTFLTSAQKRFPYLGTTCCCFNLTSDSIGDTSIHRPRVPGSWYIYEDLWPHYDELYQGCHRTAWLLYCTRPIL